MWRRRRLLPLRLRLPGRRRALLLDLRARPSGQELEQRDATKHAASEAILALGGTIIHHHSVGRDHRPWYLCEVPELFAAALRAAKAELDPAGVMNPGVIIPPVRPT